MRSVIFLGLLFAGLGWGQVGFSTSGYFGAGVTSGTVSVSGSNPLLIAELVCNGTGITASSMAWGSTNLTAAAVQPAGANQYGRAFYAAVSAGSNTLAASITGSMGTCYVSWAYYTGVGSVAQVLANTCTSVAGSSSEQCQEGSITTTSTNGWIVNLVQSGSTTGDTGSPQIGGVNAGTVRENVIPWIWDDGPLSPGSYTVSIYMCGYCGAAVFNSTMLELAPAGGSSAVIQSHLIIH